MYLHGIRDLSRFPNGITRYVPQKVLGPHIIKSTKHNKDMLSLAIKMVLSSRIIDIVSQFWGQVSMIYIGNKIETLYHTAFSSVRHTIYTKLTQLYIYSCVALDVEYLL